MSLIKYKKQLSIIKSIIVSRIGSKLVIRETSYANDEVHVIVSDTPMGGLVTWQCACGKRGGVGISGTVYVDVDVDVDLA